MFLNKANIFFPLRSYCWMWNNPEIKVSSGWLFISAVRLQNKKWLLYIWYYCFPGQCHFFLLWTTNCSHHICQLQQQLFAAAWDSPNRWALSEFPVSNLEQGWSPLVHKALWGLGDPAAESGGWNPETRDSENDRTCSWNPHRYCLLTTSRSLSYSAKSTHVWDSDQNIQALAPRDVG